jgi:hypothetical protein
MTILALLLILCAAAILSAAMRRPGPRRGVHIGRCASLRHSREGGKSSLPVHPHRPGRAPDGFPPFGRLRRSFRGNDDEKERRGELDARLDRERVAMEPALSADAKPL